METTWVASKFLLEKKRMDRFFTWSLRRGSGRDHLKLLGLLMSGAVDGCRGQQAYIIGTPHMGHQIGNEPIGGQNLGGTEFERDDDIETPGNSMNSPLFSATGKPPF